MLMKAAKVSRYLLGFNYFVFGLNGFLRFIPVPPMSESAMKFVGAIVETNYLMQLVKLIEVVGGLCLLSGFFMPLALVVLAPITINIALIHVILDPGNIHVSISMVLLHLLAAHTHRDLYLPLMKIK